MSDRMPAALPAGTVLLHIGPHKTGTTTLQGAFHAARKTVLEHGVTYAGHRRQPWLAALAATGSKGRPGDPTPEGRHWQALVEEVAGERRRHRVFVSSERFADAETDAIRRIVTDLGGPKVHVLVTLRPLAKILPSQWQQSVRNGLVMRYPRWLRKMLQETGTASVSPTFWHRHGHAELVQRWADVVGPENVTVLVLDESDREMYLRAVEAMLDLPAGILVPQPSLTNRSLTKGEIEVVRLLNEEFRRREWPGEIYAQYVRLGVIKHMLGRQPGDDEPAITTPRWALKKSGAIGAAAAEKIAGSGVNVVGDLASLGAVPAAPHPATGDPAPADSAPALAGTAVPALAAANALTGSISAAQESPWPRRFQKMSGTPAGQDVEERKVLTVPARELVGVVLRRGRRKLRRKVLSRLPG